MCIVYICIFYVYCVHLYILCILRTFIYFMYIVYIYIFMYIV